MQDSIEATYVLARKHLYRYTNVYHWCHRHIDERTPGCWFLTGLSGFITLATGDMKRIKRSGPRTVPSSTPVDIVVEGEDESILTKDERFVR